MTALNINYSDNELFGIYTACDGSAAGKVGPVVLCEQTVILDWEYNWIFVHVAAQVCDEAIQWGR